MIITTIIILTSLFPKKTEENVGSKPLLRSNNRLAKASRLEPNAPQFPLDSWIPCGCQTEPDCFSTTLLPIEHDVHFNCSFPIFSGLSGKFFTYFSKNILIFKICSFSSPLQILALTTPAQVSWLIRWWSLHVCSEYDF